MVKPEEIKVPQGMVNAVVFGGLDPNRTYSSAHLKEQRDHATTILIRALTWLTSNPICPNPSTIQETLGKLTPAGQQIAIEGAIQWQQRMFLKPKHDPELQLILDGIRKRNAVGFIDSEVDSLVINAFEAGKKVAEHEFMNDFQQDVRQMNETMRDQTSKRYAVVSSPQQIPGDQGRRNE